MKAQNADSFHFFDDEVKYLKVFSKRLNDDIKKFMNEFVEQTGKSKSVSKELRRRVEELSEAFDMFVKKDPTPEELRDLYMQYEKEVMESQYKGQKWHHFSEKTASEVAKFAERLAAYVAAEADIGTWYDVRFTGK